MTTLTSAATDAELFAAVVALGRERGIIVADAELEEIVRGKPASVVRAVDSAVKRERDLRRCSNSEPDRGYRLYFFRVVAALDLALEFLGGIPTYRPR